MKHTYMITSHVAARPEGPDRDLVVLATPKGEELRISQAELDRLLAGPQGITMHGPQGIECTRVGSYWAGHTGERSWYAHVRAYAEEFVRMAQERETERTDPTACVGRPDRIEIELSR